MSKLEVKSTTVPKLLKCLVDGEWLIPQFQRDFVWSNAAIIALVNSIIDANPVGMITLWEQEDSSQLALEHISVPDSNGPTYYGDLNARTGRYYAVLDGRQRSTAIALVFGGLKASNGLYKHSGSYFLDVAAKDDKERVSFFSTRDLQRKQLTSLSAQIGRGLFPLEVSDPDGVHEKWMDYLQEIQNPKNYPNGEMPDHEEISRRNSILKKAFSGIINTQIAVYIVPKSYSLAEICEIFETLNTTGTKVSTVDLIHSWLFSDTLKAPSGPILLRDEIDELGEIDGAVKWASSKDRPELIAQFVAACHLALDVKPQPRSISGAKPTKITSVKSPDLLAIPSEFWSEILKDKGLFAKCIGDFQLATAGGYFSMEQCPYPASASIYVSLRWYFEKGRPQNVYWTLDHLNALYRAFFWRNVFRTRYDQGFLTQIGTDIESMKELLNSTPADSVFEDWKIQANGWLDKLFDGEVTEEAIRKCVADDGTGALRKGCLLLMCARASSDPVDPSLSLANSEFEFHHIYPKDWCRNNSVGELAILLDPKKSESGWINSPANLIPMHRKSNLTWRKQNPGQFIANYEVDYRSNSELWARYFVTQEAFEQLSKGGDGLKKFWELRRDTIAKSIYQKTFV